MGIVLLTLLAAGAILFGLWALAIAKAQKIEQAARKRIQTESDECANTERELASLRQPGVSLYCLGCGRQFEGPLTDDGCPECHLTTLVVLSDHHKAVQNEQQGQPPSGE